MKASELINYINDHIYETDINLFIKDDTAYCMEIYSLTSGHHDHSEVITSCPVEDLKTDTAGTLFLEEMREKGILKKAIDRYTDYDFKRVYKLSDEVINRYKETPVKDWKDISFDDDNRMDIDIREEIENFSDIISGNITIDPMDKWDIEYYKDIKEQFMRGSDPLADKAVEEVKETIEEYEKDKDFEK